MRSFLKLGDLHKGNRLNVFESNRLIRQTIVTNQPSPNARRDHLFLGNAPAAPSTRAVPDVASASDGDAQSPERRRIRRFAQISDLAPAPPGQIAFALGRIYTGLPSGVTPVGVVTEVDIQLNQIGNVFGHPAGREALFNETAIVPTGVGEVTPGGTLAQAAGMEGHYIYFVRVTGTGNATAGTYFYQRLPYRIGAYLPGSSLQDAEFTAGEILGDRFYDGQNARVTFDLSPLIANTAAPTPAAQAYQLDFPTQAARENIETSLCAGQAWDGISRYWWVYVDDVENNNATASRSRALWSWYRFAPLMPQREDAADGFGSTPVSGYPTLPTNVQYRDIKAARGGFLFIAADGLSDDGNGTAETGALIQVNANTDAVTNVHGTTATGIYTVAGLRSNDIVGITIDRTESFAAAGFDRVWVLHRNGLSYGDMNTSTGAIAAWNTVANAGADFNTVDVDSLRGLGGVDWDNAGASGSSRNAQQPLIDHDSSGNVYWASSQGAGNFTAGINRLNRLIGDASAHTFYSLDGSAEVGATGFIQLGNNVTGTAVHVCSGLVIHRATANDPNDDLIHITGIGSTSVTTNAILRIFEAADWGTNNPGAGYYSDEAALTTTSRALVPQVAPDGQLVLTSFSQTNAALLPSLGDRQTSTNNGTGASFAAPVGNNQDLTLAGGSSFDSRWVNRLILISGAANAANNGVFRVVSVASGTSITIENPSGVSETVAFSWTLEGDFLDPRSTLVATNGSIPDADELNACRWWPPEDESGLGHIAPYRAASGVEFAQYSPFSITYNRNGANWYPRRRAYIEQSQLGNATMSTSAVELDSGVTVTFANSGIGGDEFVASEYYTFGVSEGLLKDPTQELSYFFDLYWAETDLVARPDDAEGSQNKTAAYGTATGGFIQSASLASVTTDNPFTGVTAEQSRQLVFPQSQFLLDGNNNTLNINLTSTSYSDTVGSQQALDLGADTVVSQLRLMQDSDANNDGNDWVYDLYSATAAAGPASWTLRGSFERGSDAPGLIYRTDAFRENTGDVTTTSPFIIIFDLGVLENTGIFGTNSAARYWKVVYRRRTGTGTSFNGYQAGPLYALNGSGNPAGFTQAQYLNTAPDSNWLANFVIRAVFVQDTGTGSAARGPSNNQVTLTADTFATDIGQGDFFRVLSSGAIVQELVVDSRDSNTQLTFTTDAAAFSASDWEVVRNADVRPRDNAGGGENVSRFPPTGVSGQNEVFICPIRGFIYYNDEDVSNARTFRVERYVKVQRAV
jgi:hypothetical protein